LEQECLQPLTKGCNVTGVTVINDVLMTGTEYCAVIGAHNLICIDIVAATGCLLCMLGAIVAATDRSRRSPRLFCGQCSRKRVQHLKKT